MDHNAAAMADPAQRVLREQLVGDLRPEDGNSCRACRGAAAGSAVSRGVGCAGSTSASGLEADLPRTKEWLPHQAPRDTSTPPGGGAVGLQEGRRT